MTLPRQPSVLATALALLIVAAPAWAADRVAVIPLAGEDTTAMAEALRDAVRADKTYEVLTEEETREQIVAAADLGLSCTPDDVGCLSKIGVLGDFQRIISPVTSTGAEGIALVLILIDVGEGKEVARTRRPITSDPKAIALDALAELLDPEGYVGLLTLLVSPDGAEVELDGEPLGVSPLAPARQVRAGRHLLVVRHPDHPESKQEIDVVKGETLSFAVNLIAEKDPGGAREASGAGGVWTNPWVIAPAAVAASGMVAAVGGAIFTAGSYYALGNCSAPQNEEVLFCVPDIEYPIYARSPGYVIGGMVVAGLGISIAGAAALTTLIAASVIIATEE